MTTADYGRDVGERNRPRNTDAVVPAPPAAGPDVGHTGVPDTGIRETDLRDIDRRDTDGRGGDRITGGPAWGGFVVALATWITLEVLLIAVDLGAVAAGVGLNPDTDAWWWSLAAAVIALFAGGLTAGAASRWRGVADGILLGITVWALTLVALLLLSALGAGIGFGAFGQLFGTGRAASGGAGIPAEVGDLARDAARVALLTLGLTAAAAAAGGAVAAKLWPRPRHAQHD